MTQTPPARTAADSAFDLTLALLFTHELDAVARHEWRLFPGLRSLPDGVASRLFVLLHVPLFVVLFRRSFSSSPDRRRRSRVALARFAVVHALLHRRFRTHPDYEFSGPLSALFVRGTAAAGLAFLAASRSSGDGHRYDE
jgi:hypothetical protein